MTPRPDTRLEVALDTVLVRYGIKLDEPFAVLGADRGDLASDLADEARRVLGVAS